MKPQYKQLKGTGGSDLAPAARSLRDDAPHPRKATH